MRLTMTVAIVLLAPLLLSACENTGDGMRLRLMPQEGLSLLPDRSGIDAMADAAGPTPKSHTKKRRAA